VFYKNNVRTTIANDAMMDPAFFAMFVVVVLGGVVLRFPNNLVNNLNKSFRNSYFLTF
jgi:hypothetical protein